MIRRNEQGILIVVSGPSGCGKSTVDNVLINERQNIIMSVSDTTRAKRDGETDGIDYNFITKEEFEKNIESNKYLEYAKVHSNKYYGTPSNFVNKKLKEGVIKSIMYIKSRRRFKNIYSMILDESYISNFETVELLNMLKETLK